MTKTKVNFYCLSSTVKVIDGIAKADHRDRTSMLNKMIDFYLSHHDSNANPPENLQQTNGTKAVTTKKKAGAR